MNPIIDTPLFKAIHAAIPDWDAVDLAQQLAEASTTVPVDWNANDLGSAFVWYVTPQGEGYWARQQERSGL